ncbi:MAG: hypothetical protein IJ899_11225 [Blautia sp.]|nr:hypothetical protein [Blautia sp.]
MEAQHLKIQNTLRISKTHYLQAVEDPFNRYQRDIWLCERGTDKKRFIETIQRSSESVFLKAAKMAAVSSAIALNP